MKRLRGPTKASTRPFKRPRQASKAPTRSKSTAAILKPELKFNDVTFNTDASTTSTEVALTTFAAGDTALLRDGNKAIIKSIDLKINCANSALTQNNTVRFVVVCDKLAQAEQCIWGDGTAVGHVFDDDTTVARRAVISASRFIVLMDEVIVLNQGSGTGGALEQAYFKKHIKVPEALRLASWGSSGSSIPVQNAFTLMYLGSTASGATDATVVGTARIRFVG